MHLRGSSDRINFNNIKDLLGHGRKPSTQVGTWREHSCCQSDSVRTTTAAVSAGSMLVFLAVRVPRLLCRLHTQASQRERAATWHIWPRGYDAVRCRPPINSLWGVHMIA